MLKTLIIAKTLLLLLLLQACSGNNGFQLRKNVELAPLFQTVYVEKLPRSSTFYSELESALLDAGGRLVYSKNQAKSVINFSRFDEGRRIIAYDSNRQAREYLLFLKIDYTLKANSTKQKMKSRKAYRINIDRSYLFDSNFALGKAEEEKQVKQALYQEAVRLILLRIKYAS